MKKEKFMKIANNLDVVFKILQIILSLCLILLCACFVIIIGGYMISPELTLKAMKSTAFEVIISDLSIGLLTDGLDTDKILIYNLISYMYVAVSVVFLYIGVKYIRKILSPIKEGLPFQENMAKTIKKFAMFVLIFGVLDNICSFILDYFVIHGFDIIHLLKSEQISSISISYSLNFDFIIVYFVIMLLSYVFQYGMELQKLSDETL